MTTSPPHHPPLLIRSTTPPQPPPDSPDTTSPPHHTPRLATEPLWSPPQILLLSPSPPPHSSPNTTSPPPPPPDLDDSAREGETDSDSDSELTDVPSTLLSQWQMKDLRKQMRIYLKDPNNKKHDTEDAEADLEYWKHLESEVDWTKSDAKVQVINHELRLKYRLRQPPVNNDILNQTIDEFLDLKRQIQDYVCSIYNDTPDAGDNMELWKQIDSETVWSDPDSVAVVGTTKFLKNYHFDYKMSRQ
jgi:hypothetical protein